MTDEPMAAVALQRIQDHIDGCAHNYAAMTETFIEVKDAIKDTNKLLLSFISFVALTVVTFAGYTYVQQESLARQLADARAAQAAAVQQIPEKTVQKLTGSLPPIP